MAKNIMIQGTMSNAGKSLITAGLCRIFAQDGYKVAPFKSQNMALNSFITKDGGEMGRAQVVQAESSGILPDVRMNPILLKPTTDVGSQVIVNGKSIGNMNAMELPESLDNEGVDYDPQAYAKVKELSTLFDRIKHILDAYSPDFIFIFNWVDAEGIFEGLNVTWHKEHYIDDKLAVYTIEGYSTKIIWSSHPRRFSFIGENTESMVRLLGNKLNELI